MRTRLRPPGAAGSRLWRILAGLSGPGRKRRLSCPQCLDTKFACPEKMPVLVWLYGGDYGVGSGGAAFYDGANLAAKHDVVLLTINHRLNIFGYLYLHKLCGDRFADCRQSERSMGCFRAHGQSQSCQPASLAGLRSGRPRHYASQRRVSYGYDPGKAERVALSSLKRGWV